MFNRAPDRIPIEGAATKQGILFWIGVLFGLLSLGAFQNASISGVLICGGLCALFWYFASQVKTHYEAQDQFTRYK